jgi:hypothetical protein
MQLILGAVLGIVLFLCCLISYITGFKHCKAMSKGEVPKLNLNPVEAIKKHIEVKEEKKQVDKYTEEWNNLFSYTGDAQKEGDKD